MKGEIGRSLAHWFETPGAYVLVDGQFGSTGKGVIAGLMAEHFWPYVEWVVSNAGPNSGHTSYVGDEKIVLKQLPTFAVVASKLSAHKPPRRPKVHLSAGAVIDPDVLNRELREHSVLAQIHPHAALINSAAKADDAGNVQSIASTGQGVGPALVNKLRRRPDAVWGPVGGHGAGSGVDLSDSTCFFEVSQGFSLGINSGFYPHTTTRECTVSQALADAGCPPTFFRRSILSVRTYPIRVGSTENSSGPCYADQEEIAFEDIGQQPEYTTVTGRQRRIFTWSKIQFKAAVRANAPAAIFVNFMQYLGDVVDHEEWLWKNVMKPYREIMGFYPETVLLGYGPKSEDVQVWSW